MTGKQRRALQNVLSYCDEGFNPSAGAVRMFFDHSDKGIRLRAEQSQDYNEYTHLLMGHHLMSGAQREMWLEGHLSGDYPLGLLVGDYIRDIGESRIKYNSRIHSFRQVLRLYNEYRGIV